MSVFFKIIEWHPCRIYQSDSMHEQRNQNNDGDGDAEKEQNY